MNEKIDGERYEHFIFEFCTFEKIGAKGAKFVHCEFRHCEFIDCYLAHATFDHCSLTGSFFEKCVFSWAEFPGSGLDYTNFLNCGPVIQQIINQKPTDPQNAAKFLRNLAAEHRRLGNWDQVDRFVIESYKERERHFWYVVNGENDHYRGKYGTRQRIGYVFRLLGYKLSGFIFGYGISWATFLRTMFIFGFLLFPFLNSIFGKSIGEKPDWATATGEEIWAYFSDLYTVSTKSFFPFVPSPAGNHLDLTIPFWLSSIEAVFGTSMIAVFAALLFRWASKGL